MEDYNKMYEDQMIEQAMENQMIEQAIEDQMIEQAMEDQMIEQAMEDQMIEQAMEDQAMEDYYSSGRNATMADAELANVLNSISPTYHLVKGDHEYFAFTSYIPKRFQANAIERSNRNLVYSFKSGQSSVRNKVASRVSDFLNDNLLNQNKAVFMVIPASTEQKNSIRFESFANLVCKNTGIRNAINGISILKDREANKGKTGINKTDNLNFDSDTFKGKYVILFDDVITSGGSFKQIADVLIRKGAIKVTGIFLAKTIHK